MPGGPIARSSYKVTHYTGVNSSHSPPRSGCLPLFQVVCFDFMLPAHSILELFVLRSFYVELLTNVPDKLDRYISNYHSRW